MYCRKLFFLNLFQNFVFFSRALSPDVIQASVSFFANLKFSSAFLCNERDVSIALKSFSAAGIRSNVFDVSKSRLGTSVLENPYPGTAIIIDTSCNGSFDVLMQAAEEALFDSKNQWLIILEENYSEEDLKNAAHWAEPEQPDLIQYLKEGMKEMKRGKILAKFSRNLNEKVLSEIQEENYEKNFTEPEPDSVLQKIMTLNAMVNSEVTIAVPSTAEEYNLYEIHRMTNFTRMNVSYIGLMGNQSIELAINRKSAVLRRTDFHRAIVLSTLAFNAFDYSNRSGELTSRFYDDWNQMGLQQSQLAEEQLNFRMVLKCFDDYGWFDGIKYTGMLKWLKEKRAEMAGNGFLLHRARMEGVDFVQPGTIVRMGVILRVPTLSQVSNIFVLTFAPEVWICLLILLLGCMAFLFLQFKVTKSFGENRHPNEVFTFITASTLQQGTDMNTSLLSVRLTMLVYLVAALFLFTAYTANIVTLLQTQSKKIQTLTDLSQSPFDMAVQQSTYLINVVKSDADPAMQQLVSKKVLPHDNFMDSNEGVEKVRKQLFAYMSELPPAFRLIQETYTEREKCGLKVIRVYTYWQHWLAVPKKAPIGEHLRQKYNWHREVGLFSRIESRWRVAPTSCVQGVGGFSSVGITDMLPVFTMFFYGVSSAVVLLFGEICVYQWNAYKNMTRKRKVGFVESKGKQKLSVRKSIPMKGAKNQTETG